MIPRASRPNNQNINNRSNIITNSKKTMKNGTHQKIFLIKKENSKPTGAAKNNEKKMGKTKEAAKETKANSKVSWDVSMRAVHGK